MKYSVNVKYWHDSHDHEIFFTQEPPHVGGFFMPKNSDRRKPP